MFQKFPFLYLLAALIALRLFHFGPEIDAPHDWRQCDTAHYIRDFYDNGIDLLHPAVCWMGASDTLALEFPLPEVVVALAYHAFGGESVPVARLIFLGFFAGALFYFYNIADFLFGRSTARWAALVYLALPLSIFYSRAIHIDFSALLCAHAMLYYFLVGVEKRDWKYLFVSGLFASIALLIKAPYAFYFAAPMLFWAIRNGAFWWVVQYAGPFYGLALGLFWLWQQHVQAINGAAPDWNYILHYRKMVDNAHWYFGSLQQRLSLYSWRVLLERGVWEVAGVGSLAFLLVGGRHLKKLPSWPFLGWWIFGLIAYVFIFFNLNEVHNYYQIPLLGPVAVLCAWGLQKAGGKKTGLLYLFFGVLVAANVTYTELSYFKVSAEHVEIGRLIRENTPDSTLVIVTYQNMDCRNPKILYRARRRGWSIEEAALRPEVLERLRAEEGAQYWVYAGRALPAVQLGNYANILPNPVIINLIGTQDSVYIFNLIK